MIFNVRLKHDQMYHDLLDYLIYHHSTVQLKNKLQALPYKYDHPVIIVNSNVFEIEHREYAIILENYLQIKNK